MPAKRAKYKLFAGPDNGEKKPCAFFLSPDGCRNGNNCKFSHGEVVPSCPTANSSNEDASIVSSESEGEMREETPKQKPKTSKQVKGEESGEEQHEKGKNHDDSSDSEEQSPFVEFSNERKEEPKKKKARRAKHSDPFALNGGSNKKAKTAASPSATNTIASNIKEPKQQERKNSSAKKATVNSSSSAGSFDLKALNLPIASFSIPNSDVVNVSAATKPDQNESSNKKKAKVKTPKSSTATPTTNNTSPYASMAESPETKAAPHTPTPPLSPPLPERPLPKSTPTGLKWLEVVKKTRIHPKYKRSYDFEKFIEMDKAIGGKAAWVKPKPFGPWCAKNPQCIAIDCEMCETKDPVSGVKDHRALCRISVVNGEDGSVLLDTLVKPAWPVTDYRTWINGIDAKDMESVQFTARHAQAFMLALCSEETVILGHAVHNDLAAIRMEHQCVGDSANLYEAADSPTATVSLKDLVANVLKKEMPETHDSVNDARAALACLDHYREKKGQVKPIERDLTKVAKAQQQRNSGYGNKLFIHRIPKDKCTESHLSTMFLVHTDLQPKEVEPIQFTGNVGKTYVVFRSTRHAELAFDTLQDKAVADPTGRLQKKVFLRNGSYIRVRKMAHEKDINGSNKSC